MGHTRNSTDSQLAARKKQIETAKVEYEQERERRSKDDRQSEDRLREDHDLERARRSWHEEKPPNTTSFIEKRVQEIKPPKAALASQGQTSAGLSRLHSKLEGQIQRLQRHTEELRSNLHGTPGSDMRD